MKSGENAIFEAKLDALNKRVMNLEQLLGSVMDLGVDMKAAVKVAKDPYTLIDKMADRLANLDGALDNSVGRPNENSSEGGNRVLGRKAASRGIRSKR